MRRIQTLPLCAVVTVLCWLSAGCQFMPHQLQPSQLWKMNRQPAWDESAFSVPDPGQAGTGDHTIAMHRQIDFNVHIDGLLPAAAALFYRSVAHDAGQSSP